ncbi:BTAD domain-containing putative transcriptional regulator [Phytohabitans sp. ZYX-F-186]|uniref:BTAD domain-containing putative transcriptional regulator n=1 Tax=Phytohabitans maris TaxID=3071409 RepID=A0ABU0ZFF2_9ACTN|nr:BTAD domain-containing putative transcriptional regulator [Phytohabitans sp. ZYX-F-186]MDQ7905786.1 BTAD domain-containing putative transcriptional regulator [Phytohabitans sp. ZYX-F-186]
MEFRLLGAPEVWVDGRQVELTAGKPMALLAAGLLRANRVVSTSVLVDAVWGDAPPATAAALVQTYVSNLRRALLPGGRPVILTRPPGYLFDVGHDDLDVSRFESLAAAGRAAAAAGEDREAVRTLGQALAIWRGPALDGLRTPVLRQAAEGLEEQRLGMVEERIGAELRLGRSGSLAAELATLVGAHPLRETLRAQQMLVLYRLGRQADALEAYRQARELLRAELGIDPGPELRRMHQAILTGDPALRPPPSDPVAVTGPEPAPGPEPAAEAVPRQLPPAIGELIGRDRQIERLRQLLRRAPAAGQPVCCAITGKAGSGKTALAVAAAHAAGDVFDDGHLYAAFRSADAGESGEILAAFLRALGEPASRLPESVEELSGLFRSRIAGRRILILLDNAGPEAQIRPLLPAHGGSAVLLTSRTALMGLDPQGTLGLDVLEPGDALLLLLARLVGAERVAAEPAAADEIVRLCGGLPLAVRTAGARLAVRQRWPLSVLAARLRDEHRRLDELVAGDLEVRASLQLSYSGLPDPTRLAFRRLGVAGVGEFSPWLLEPLLDVAESRAEYFAERLADAQLVDATGVGLDGQVRYGVHDLIRLFAQERADAEEPTADQRHTVERLGRRLLATIADLRARVPSGGGPAADAQAWLDQERWLLVQTVERASRLGLHRLAGELCTAVRVSFRLRNAFEAWWRTHQAALGAARAAGDRLGEANLLRGLGQLRYEQDRLDDAAEFYGRALEAFRELGDLRGQADCLIGLASTHREEGRFPEALRLLDEASRACARLEDTAGLAECAYGIGYVDREVGDFAGAEAALRRALAAYRRIGDRRGEGLTLRSMAMVHRARGELDAAEPLATRAVAVFEEIGDDLLAAYGQQCLAKVRIRQGRPGLAEEPLRAALRVCADLGDRFGAALVTRTIGELHLAAGDLEAAEARLGEAREHWVAMGLDLFRARTDRDLAEVHRRRGDLATAGELHARALATFQRYGSRERHELAARPAS